LREADVFNGDLAAIVLPAVLWQHFRVWGVFLLCLIFSFAGVAASFWLFGGTITGLKAWPAVLLIAAVMLGISYGAKYANANARETFTPVDLVQYLSQGFLWPSTWPGLAKYLNIESIAPPAAPGAAKISILLSGGLDTMANWFC